MDKIIILIAVILIISLFVTVGYIILRIGAKKAKESIFARITMQDYMEGKTEIRIAELHKHYSDQNIRLKGFIVYPIID